MFHLPYEYECGAISSQIKKRFFHTDVLLTMNAKITIVRTREKRNYYDNGNYKDSRNFCDIQWGNMTCWIEVKFTWHKSEPGKKLPTNLLCDFVCLDDRTRTNRDGKLLKGYFEQQKWKLWRAVIVHVLKGYDTEKNRKSKRVCICKVFVIGV